MRALADRLILAVACLVVSARFARLLLRVARRQPRGARRWPDVALPRTGNEKFLWRKVFDHDPLFTTLSDKLACKAWVEGLGLGLDMAAVRWTGRDAALIPEGLLAGDVVVKANHGQRTNLFPRRDGLSRDEVVRRANAFLHVDHGRRDHEWGYFDVDRRLFVEDMLGGPEGRLVELKVYTFGAVVPRVTVIDDRFGLMAAARWEPGPDGAPRRHEGRTDISGRILSTDLPPTWLRALALAKAIGSPFDHVRVDLLTDGERLWLGEVTVYNLAGWFPDSGHRPDAPFARAWDLRGTWFLMHRHRSPLLRLYAGALRRRLGGAPRADVASF